MNIGNSLLHFPVKVGIAGAIAFCPLDRPYFAQEPPISSCFEFTQSVAAATFWLLNILFIVCITNCVSPSTAVLQWLLSLPSNRSLFVNYTNPTYLYFVECLSNI